MVMQVLATDHFSPLILCGWFFFKALMASSNKRWYLQPPEVSQEVQFLRDGISKSTLDRGFNKFSSPVSSTQRRYQETEVNRATERPQLARTLQTDLQQVTHVNVTPHTARNRLHEDYMKSTSEDFFHGLEPNSPFSICQGTAKLSG